MSTQIKITLLACVAALITVCVFLTNTSNNNPPIDGSANLQAIMSQEDTHAGVTNQPRSTRQIVGRNLRRPLPDYVAQGNRNNNASQQNTLLPEPINNSVSITSTNNTPDREIPSQTVTIETPGQTAISLAQKYYQDNSLAAALIAANPGIFGEQLSIAMGQTVLIPSRNSINDFDTLAQSTDNSDYIIPVDTTPASSQEVKSIPSRLNTYTVKSGDLLSTIALRELGSSHQWKDIAALNPGINPNAVPVGTELLMPTIAREAATTTASSNNAHTVTQAPTYTVKPGDSLSEIAQEVLGSSARWRDIAALNPDINPNAISTGMKLQMPANTQASTQARSNTAPAIKLTPVSTETAPSTQHTYTIQAGDILGKIAQEQLGSSRHWPAIVDLNPGINPNNLVVGNTLLLPNVTE